MRLDECFRSEILFLVSGVSGLHSVTRAEIVFFPRISILRVVEQHGSPTSGQACDYIPRDEWKFGDYFGKMITAAENNECLIRESKIRNAPRAIRRFRDGLRALRFYGITRKLLLLHTSRRFLFLHLRGIYIFTLARSFYCYYSRYYLPLYFIALGLYSRRGRKKRISIFTPMRGEFSSLR